MHLKEKIFKKINYFLIEFYVNHLNSNMCRCHLGQAKKYSIFTQLVTIEREMVLKKWESM